MVKNSELSAIFYEMADILEIKNIKWKPQAYRKAARAIDSLQTNISRIYKKAGIIALKEIPGIGESIAKKIVEFIRTKKIKEYEKLKKQIPFNTIVLTKVPGIGVKKLKIQVDTIKNVKININMLFLIFFNLILTPIKTNQIIYL